MRITRITVAAVCTAAAVTLAGCGSETTDGQQHTHVGSDDHQVIEPLSPQQTGADQTAITALQMILSWQPAIDESKADALIRATAYLGGDLLAVAESGTRAEVRPDPDWQQWAASKDAVAATCVRADSTPAAPDGMRTLVIDLTCTQTVLHAGGRSTRLTPQLWRTTVTRTDAGWRLIDYRFQQ
ncbi:MULTISPECIES: hypothetical protein [unclassified Rhodococcus (in: high G+C Gram-positive bacteria)]|uniref:hypothetical protein n=1 Tax=unclassified Rhodococcus (in: high G+C Gram-positive bacteria) TaxID=192944 RepID=UPI000926887C|nr:hypothetical protein [Rhodococcus sp. M8]OLL16037.1 hypothetical protein BKE56_028040 [Rhodococcus sp. M8]QPG48495.1 hypothetical protein ISO16_28185 [Rhodococcus sp. M8]